MFLHECYLVPMPALQAVVEYLKARPYNEAAPLLQGLDGVPNGTSEAILAAKISVHPDDSMAFRQMVNAVILSSVGGNPDTLPTPGETVVDFPAGVGRRE